MFQVDDLKTALVVAAACSWVTLVVLSLVPSRWQLSGDLRCATTFFIAAAVTRAAFREFETRWQLAGFMITAAVFWAYQMWTERRDVSSTRWLASVWAAFIGAVIMRTVAHHHLWRHLRFLNGTCRHGSESHAR